MNRRILFCLLAGGLFLSGPDPTFAQLDPDREVGVRVTAKGIGRYSPGRWGLVELRVMNRGESEASPVSVSWLKKDRNLEFSRQLTVPPGSIRTSWYPIFIPESVSDRGTPNRLPTVELQSNTRVVVDGNEQIKRGDSYDRVETLNLRLFGGKRCVVFLSDETERQREISERLAALFQDSPREKFIPLTESLLPATSEGYDVADVVILAGDRVAEDEGALSALMDWVLGGGTLWLMLDQTGPATTRQFTQDLFSLDVIDHVTLTEFEISSIRRRVPFSEVKSTEKPVDFLRVLTEGVEVSHEVNGWPAAFSRPMGSGRIVCTTLGIEGWYIPRDWARQEELSRNAPGYQLTPALKDLLSSSVLSLSEPAVPYSAQEAYVTSHIGTEIPGRNLILAVLGTFLTFLVVTVALLKRADKIETAGIAIPVLALVTVAGLGSIGVVYRGESDRIAQFQFLAFEPGQPLVHAQGILATSSTAGLPGPFSVPEGGRFLPDRTGTGLGVWRREQEDPPAWSFHLAQIPAGVRLTPFKRSLRPAGEVSVNGTFDSEGFVGTVKTGSLGSVEDVTIAGPTQFTASPIVDESGQFTVASSDILPPGEFLGGRVLNDEQQRRQAVLQKTLTIEDRNVWFPQRLTMLAWAEPVNPGIELPIKKRTGGALLSIPLVIQRPVDGTAMRIPSLFMRMQSIRGDKGKGYSSAYSNTKGVWNRKTSGGASTMQFSIPPELLPVELSSATFRLNISAPLRKVVLSAGPPGQRVQLDSKNSLVGDFSYQISDPRALTLDQDGGLQVVLDVGDVTTALEDRSTDSEIRDESWGVHSMQMQVEARTVSSR